LHGQNTLFEQTVLRTGSLEDVRDPVVLCNVEHRFLVAEQLLRLGSRGTIILEPEGRNTAPAVAIGALLCSDDDPVLLVMPADHDLHGEALNAAVKNAMPLAMDGYLVTFGIAPEKPETGYGYLRRGAALLGGYKVDAFAEKPSLEQAAKYVDSGQYLWNSGIFLFKASAYLSELKRLAPQMYSTCVEAVNGRVTDMDFIRLPRDVFAACPSDSIDYAVMEKTDKCAMVILENSGWSDLGSWTSVYEAGEKTADGNVCKGDVMLDEVRNCYLHSESRLISAVGVENLVIVETSDAILVADKDKAQNVKKIVSALCEKGDEKALLHRKVYRPWGSYEGTDKDKRFQVKRISVKPGQILSLQKHHHRAEHWVVVSGTAKITNGDKEFLLTEDQSTYIPVGGIHRLENPGCIPLDIIEIQTGSYLGEDDIVRFDDVYGRGEVEK
jgi:mannose-1-phosphate guanylyltransferase/mannose-6-phosphate isomerase